MRRLLKIYLEKPELAAASSCSSCCVVFQIRSNGVFLSPENLRGMLGLLPEVGLVAIGVTHPDDLRRVRPFGRLGLRADADDDGGHAERRRALPAGRRCSASLVAAAIGFVNGYVTIKFAIPSFITTLGMLFMARSLTVVISGGFPPLLPPSAAELAVHALCRAGRAVPHVVHLVRRRSPSSSTVLLSLHQFRQLGARDRRLPAGGAVDGHPDSAREDRLLHALLDAGRLCRHRSRCCGSARRCPRSARGSSCRRWRPR